MKRREPRVLGSAIVYFSLVIYTGPWPCAGPVLTAQRFSNKFLTRRLRLLVITSNLDSRGITKHVNYTFGVFPRYLCRVVLGVVDRSVCFLTFVFHSLALSPRDKRNPTVGLNPANQQVQELGQTL